MKHEDQTLKISGPRPRQPGVFVRLITSIAAAGVLLVGLMFSALIFVGLALLGLAIGVYFWWKTRDFRHRLRKEQKEMEQENWSNEESSDFKNDGNIYEGEAFEVNEYQENQRINPTSPHSERH